MMYDLSRFHEAQRSSWSGYETALREIRNGRKVSHWIWYIFPQLKGLGKSEASVYYGIHDLGEAKAYAADPILGAHLEEITRALLDQPNDDGRYVMGSSIDYQKLRSCMTLFEVADPGRDIYARVLDRFYGGRRDYRTLKLLGL